jgi:hypothetical protein
MPDTTRGLDPSITNRNDIVTHFHTNLRVSPVATTSRQETVRMNVSAEAVAIKIASQEARKD